MADTEQVYIVEDDEDLRSSLEELIRTRGAWTVRSFGDGKSWLDQAGTAQPGCVLLDLYLPGIGGLDVLAAMRTQAPLHEVVVLTGEGNVSAAVSSMRAGAIDFLEKPVSWDALRQAISSALLRLRDRTAQHRRSAEALERIERLTPRERDVMMGLVEGLPNKLIAYRLGLSTRTVEVHRASLMEKMELSSLADVLKCALAAGLLKESA